MQKFSTKLKAAIGLASSLMRVINQWPNYDFTVDKEFAKEINLARTFHVYSEGFRVLTKPFVTPVAYNIYEGSESRSASTCGANS
jgi:hypothetical protein